MQELIDLYLDDLSLSKTGPYGFAAWQAQMDPKVAVIEKVIEGEISFSRTLMLVRKWESGYRYGTEIS